MLSAVIAWYSAHAVQLFVGALAVTLAGEAVAVRQQKRRVVGQATSLVSGISFMAAKTLVSKVAMLSLSVAVYTRFRIVTLNPSNPGVWLVILMLRDFVYYWVHRTEHSARVLWASHMVHHSPETIGFSTAVRVPWMEAFYKPWLGLWVPLLGFNPVAFVALDALAATIGALQHTESWKRRTILDKVFVTPSAHRVHHGSNPEYIDKNYGAIFIIWDRLFGTYEPEVAPVRYGLVGTASIDTPAKALVGGYPKLVAAARRSGSLTDGFRFLMAAPS
jgi:sterol desaturase/sphingolipid hydroxylase (fatty acid hydroxylase superfamily)